MRAHEAKLTPINAYATGTGFSVESVTPVTGVSSKCAMISGRL